MTVERDPLRDWHRLFGLVLIDFFTGSPFVVEVEHDLSVQQQLLDVVILRRRRGRFAGRLPDGLDDLAAHNLLTFKSHHEALTDWAMKELLGHYVGYRKLVSASPTDLLPQGQFRLYAVCARFPHNLVTQVPWQERQAGVYDCRWGTDVVRVIVTGQSSQEAQNAPLHLFSASQPLVTFGQGEYRRRSANTSSLLGQLFETLQGEGFAMPYTMEDFQRDYAKKHFARLTPRERREALQLLSPDERRDALQSLPPGERLAFFQSLPAQEQQQLLQLLSPQERMAGLPPEERMADLTDEQIRQYLEQRSARPSAAPRRPRRRQ